MAKPVLGDGRFDPLERSSQERDTREPIAGEAERTTRRPADKSAAKGRDSDAAAKRPGKDTKTSTPERGKARTASKRARASRSRRGAEPGPGVAARIIEKEGSPLAAEANTAEVQEGAMLDGSLPDGALAAGIASAVRLDRASQGSRPAETIDTTAEPTAADEVGSMRGEPALEQPRVAASAQASLSAEGVSHEPPIGVPPPPAEVGPEYGPSIDRPTSLGLRGHAVERFRSLEERLRARLAPAHAESDRRIPPLPLLWRPLRALAMRDRSEFVDEFGRDPQVAAAVEPWLDFLYRTWFRVTVTGLEHVPEEGRALIVANHSGSLPYDGAMIMHAVRRDHVAHRDVRPLVEDFVFHFPYLGTLVNRVGGVRACQENAERLLAKEQLVAVFPEGVKGIGKLFAQRYQLQRFGRGGFIKLALKTDSPIIPTAIVGAEEIHPMLAKATFLAKALGAPYIPITPTFPLLGPAGLVPLPTKWFIAFGEPLYFNAQYGAGAVHDRLLVNKLAEQVRQRIQEMLDSLLQRRRSILFG